ncbi:MAG: phosphatidate cytidylyltransferase [Sphingomonadales bacterium]|nr:phosphatidate cytidylyltransferase [Sphingomonadales bacterium]
MPKCGSPRFTGPILLRSISKRRSPPSASGNGDLADVDGLARQRPSDLARRSASAAVMVLVAGLALAAGGAIFAVFVALVALGILHEWRRLVADLAPGGWPRGLWLIAGVVYIGFAASTLVGLRAHGWHGAAGVVLGVIAVDVGAYFAGRAIGGPKIAPRISPSKTWAGLGGAVVAVWLLLAVLVTLDFGRSFGNWPWEVDGFARAAWYAHLEQAALVGVFVAVIAQTGDFFESWMKRRAGVKDSGAWLPGHGGLFDRADGLVAVLFARGVADLVDVPSAGPGSHGLLSALGGMWQIFLRSHGSL